MYFPVAVWAEADKAVCISVPDIPGCNTAGDSMEEALGNVQEAAELALEDAVERPRPSDFLAFKDDSTYDGAVWALVNIDLGFLDTRTVRVNVTFPAGTLEEIDRAAKGRGMTRAAFLAQAARREMARPS